VAGAEVTVPGSRFQGSRFGSGFQVRFRVRGSEFAVQSSRFRVRGSEFAVQNSRFRIRGSEFAVQNSRFRIRGAAATTNLEPRTEPGTAEPNLEPWNP
jgi:hypothetical protein